MIYGVFALSLASTSCLRQQQQQTAQVRPFTPPPPRTWPAVPDTVPKLPNAPQIAPDSASTVPPQMPEMTPPELPDAPKRIARRPAAPILQPKPPATGPAPLDPPPLPQLAQIYTIEEQRENKRILDESLDRVNRNVASIEGRNLTAEQKDTLERIRTFKKQAEQAREQDLLTAVSLARRADLLAKDLLEHLP